MSEKKLFKLMAALMVAAFTLTVVSVYAAPDNVGDPDPVEVMPTFVAGDFDGDGYCDLAAIDENGVIYAWLYAQEFALFDYALDIGVLGTPVAADVDGDGLADLLFLDGTGLLTIAYAKDNWEPSDELALGLAGIPVAADFDGDGRPDLAVVDAENQWTVLLSSVNYAFLYGPWALGLEGAPIAADVDGDGLADPIAYDVETGEATYCASSNNYKKYNLGSLDLFGQTVVGDFDGDERSDLVCVLDEEINVNVRLSSAGYALDEYTIEPIPVEEDGGDA